MTPQEQENAKVVLIKEKMLLGVGILNEKHNVIRPKTMMEWGEFFEQTDKRQVAETIINGWRISTVFLGIDHGFGFGKRPLWFETMIFAEDESNPPPFQLSDKFRQNLLDTQWRYETWEQAIEGHGTIVEMIQYGLF